MILELRFRKNKQFWSEIQTKLIFTFKQNLKPRHFSPHSNFTCFLYYDFPLYIEEEM